MNQLELTKIVMDQCETVDPNFLDSFTKAERISYCFNKELAAYGINTHVSPDKTSVYLDNQGMC